MRRAACLVLLVLLPLTAGCQSNNKGKLEGTSWTSDPGKVKGTPVPEGFLKVNFLADGHLVLRGGGKHFNGTYSLGPGHMVSMHLDKELAGSTSFMETIVVEGKRMTMTDLDGTEIAFQQRNQER